jgi:hypothetical protein
VKGKLAGPAAGNRPESNLGERIFFPFIKPFYTLKLIRFKFKFKLQTIPIHKIKYKSTSSYDKICSDMNITNNYLFK